MAVSAVEQRLVSELRAHASAAGGAPRAGSWVEVLAELSPGVLRTWFVPFPALLAVAGGPGVSSAGARECALPPALERTAASSHATSEPHAGLEPPSLEPRAATAPGAGSAVVGASAGGAPEMRLRECLAEVGLGAEAVELFTVAAVTVGALATGTDLARVASAGERAGAPAARQEQDPRGSAGGCGPGEPDLAARTVGASRVLGLVASLTGLTAHLESALVAVVGDLTVRNGRVLLARKGVSGPEELSANQTRRWRARSKSLTRGEIEALTGWGEGEVSDLVALANAPAQVRDPVVASMAAGATPWRLARRFLRELGQAAHEDAAEAAGRLFGTDPGTACTDRLDPDGAVKDGPWEHKLFNRALAGEVARLASRDPQAAARAREDARARRDVKAVVNEDGTATVSVSGTASQVTAVADRLERAARQARSIGDPRSLADLRADIAMSLLLHSGLALPDPLPAGADDLVRTAWTEQMRTVLAALPPAVLNVIIPFDTLVHSPRRPLFGTAFYRPDPAAPAPAAACPGPAQTSGAPPAREREPVPGHQRDLGDPGGEGEVLSTGMVTGPFPQFLTPDAVRELALTPGTTLYRLLMDPADGRCVERSITAYAPDGAMRAQVHAADVTCRAPGCVRHAPYTQLDHVIAFGDGGPTAETNLQNLHTRHHDTKTHGGWEAVMTPDRDVTWTSLLGRIYRTRAHDYRQYSTLFRAVVDRVHADTTQALTDDATTRSSTRADGRHQGGTDGRGEPRARTTLTRQTALADAVDRAIYRALTHRGTARPLRAGDDHPDTDTDPAFHGWDTITLTHTTTTGARRHGPDPTTAQQEHDAQHAAAASRRPTGREHADLGQRDGKPASTTGDRGGSSGGGWRHSPENEPPPF